MERSSSKNSRHSLLAVPFATESETGAADRGSHTATLMGVLAQGNDAQVADRSDLGHECICSTREISNASVRRSVVTAAASW